MNFHLKKYGILMFVSLFMFSMSNSSTINLQYGENNMYNEIEHNDCNNTLNEIKENFKTKVCQRLPQFDFHTDKPNIEMFIYQKEQLVCQYILCFDTPPPEYLG